MRRKPIISSVTTKLRLQYRSRVGIFFLIYDVTQSEDWLVPPEDSHWLIG